MLIFKKEKRVVSLILEHVDKTTECVSTATGGIKAYISGDAEDCASAFSRVNVIETEADTLLREILELLYSGAYLPLIRSDIFSLMSTVDDVCNKSEDCADFFQLQLPDIPEEYRSDIAHLLDLTAECCKHFGKALRHFFKPKDKQDKVRIRSRNVSELESQIDAKERKLVAQIFKSSLDMGSKLHLQQCVASIVKISDTIEDATDELELVGMKSIV
jgi:predicted phosphate transport protein (TIGR00153 family)